MRECATAVRKTGGAIYLGLDLRVQGNWRLFVVTIMSNAVLAGYP
jgi:hypothetical protein